MNSNEQEPVRRRKLTLNKKTPTRVKGAIKSNAIGLECTPRSAHIPIPKKSLRNLRNANHKSIESSDESSLEIGWDNNSPSPSACVKPMKRNCKGRNNDISILLKNVPRKKRTEVKEQQSDQGLKTWMQDDLAVSTNSAKKSIKKNNRTLRMQSQRKKARSSSKEYYDMLACLRNATSAESETPAGSTPQRPLLNGTRSEHSNLMNVSPIDALFDESPIHEPLYDSPIASLYKNNANNVGQSLVPEDNLENINWSYVETPTIKKTHVKQPVTDNDTAKNVSCKVLYEKDNVDCDPNKPISCENVYTKDNVPMETIPFHRNQFPDENSLMNIDFDDDMGDCESALPDTIPIVSESTSCKALFKEDIVDVNNMDSKIMPCRSVLNMQAVDEENSLMNINFDDDLDEILSTQPLDIKTKETEMLLVAETLINNGCSIETKDNILLPMDNVELPPMDNEKLPPMDTKELPLIDDKDIPPIDDQDMSLMEGDMLLEDPLVNGKDDCMISQDSSVLDDKETSMLLDDNFTDVLDGFDNKDKKDLNKCQVSAAKEVINTLVANNSKVTLYTPKANPAGDLVGFDDDADDLFDDIIVSLDGVVKCKSQETPPQNITSDQRKLKSRCHTSPFPLSSKRTLLKTESKNFEEAPIFNDNNKQFARTETMNNTNDITKGKDFKEVTLKRPPDKPINEGKPLENKSNMLKTDNKNVQININKCNNNNGYSFKTLHDNKTFNVNKSTVASKPSLDLSVIGNITSRMEDDDTSMCISKKDTKLNVFTSTQKCSFDEIQRKREEAQLKLKQRNKWKK